MLVMNMPKMTRYNMDHIWFAFDALKKYKKVQNLMDKQTLNKS